MVIGSCYEGGYRKLGSALHHVLGRSIRSLCILQMLSTAKNNSLMLDTATIAFCIIHINGTS